MATDNIFVDAIAESGRNPVSEYQISLSIDEKRADTERDGQTRLARPNYQARTERGQKAGFLFN